LIGELQLLGRDGIKIKIEVLNAKAGQISATGKGERIGASHKEDPIIVASGASTASTGRTSSVTTGSRSATSAPRTDDLRFTQ
jgi:hypothetical protein